jgi:hypothetical protein
MRTETTGVTELKGGLDFTGHRAPDFDARERAVRRRAASAPRPRANDNSFLACVRRNPFLSVGIAAGVGMILGALFAGEGR